MADEDAGPSIVVSSRERERERAGVSSAPKHRDVHRSMMDETQTRDTSQTQGPLTAGPFNRNTASGAEQCVTNKYVNQKQGSIFHWPN